MQTEVGTAVRPDARVAYTTPFWKIFGSLVRETVTCRACGKRIISHAMRCAHSIVLPVEEQAGEAFTIETLFMNQLGYEPLDDICERDHEVPDDGGCEARGARYKATEVLHAAPVLVLHVLRFTWCAAQRSAVKRNTRVDFETILPPLNGQRPYDLRAVVEHRGLHSITATDSGHYVAFVRGQDAQWYECNDAQDPRRCSVNEVRSAQAYLLFYERQE